MAMPEVVSCYFTSGDHDFLLEVVVAGLPEYRRFSMEKLPRIPGVKCIHSSFSIDVLKSNGPLPFDRLG